MKAWSLRDQTTKYDIKHGGEVYDFVIGWKGSSFENQIVTISWDQTCRLSDLETGDEVSRIKLGSYCRSLAVDRTGSVIVVGTDDNNVTFIDTTTFEIIKQISVGSSIYSLAFNRRNDALLAVSKTGQVYSFKF